METFDLDQFKVKNCLPTAFYVPDFITEEEEQHIIKNVYSVPKPKWTNLSNRRLQDYGGVPHEKGMIAEKIPDWLKIYMTKVDTIDIFQGKHSNQVLINEYLPGQGIMPHTDGPLFFPTIATISCGSHTILEFLENTESRSKVCDLLLERRSLIVIKDELYSKYLHSIVERDSDTLSEDCLNLYQSSNKFLKGDLLNRSTRISVTIRNVPKVLKIKFF